MAVRRIRAGRDPERAPKKEGLDIASPSLLCLLKHDFRGTIVKTRPCSPPPAGMVSERSWPLAGSRGLAHFHQTFRANPKHGVHGGVTENLFQPRLNLLQFV